MDKRIIELEKIIQNMDKRIIELEKKCICFKCNKIYTLLFSCYNCEELICINCSNKTYKTDGTIIYNCKLCRNWCRV